MLLCPYCEKPILAGAVTIKGEKYKCTYCKVWFDNNLIQIPYLNIY